MGTYEQPTVFTPDQLNVTKGLVAGIGQGMTGISKGLAAQQANLAKAEKERISKQKGISKDIRKLTVNFGKGGDYLDETIDNKFDATVNAALKDLYDNYEYGTDAYNERVSQIEVMASMATAGMGHMQKYAGIAKNFYIPPAPGSNEFVGKKSSNNGASLNSNDPVYNQMFIDFGTNHGASGNFFTDGDKIGWNFDYYEVPNDSGGVDIVSKADMERRFNEDDTLSRDDYTLKSQQLVFNGLSDDIESGAHIIGGVDRDAFMKFGDAQWDEYGKGTYDQYKSSGGETFTEEDVDPTTGDIITKEVISYEKANRAIKDKYLANAQNMSFDQNIWQSLGFDGEYTGTAEQKLKAAGALADVAIKNKAKFDVVNYKNKSQQQTSTDKMINIYQTKRLPGVPQEAIMVVPDPNNPGVGRTVNGYAGLNSYSANDPNFRTKAGHVFGTKEAYEAGYVYDDYVKMAEYYDPSGPAGSLDELGILLSTMSPSDGVTYSSGVNTKIDLWEQYKVDYINATGKGQMDADFFKWLSGNDPNDIPVNPVPGADKILDNGFYKKNGSYIGTIQANDSTQVLNLLLKESNITTSASNKLAAGYNTQVQSNAAASSSSRSGSSNLSAPDPTVVGGQGGASAGVGNITTPVAPATPAGTPNYLGSSAVIANTPSTFDITGADGKVIQLDATPVNDMIELTGDAENDILAATANFENTFGGPGGGPLDNYGFGANKEWKEIYDTKLKEFEKKAKKDPNIKNPKYEAFKAAYNETAVPKSAKTFGFVMYEDANGNEIKALDYYRLSDDDKKKYTATENVDIEGWQEYMPDSKVRASIQDWNFNTSRSSLQLTAAASMLSPTGKKFMDKHGFTQEDVEKMMNGNVGSFKVTYTNNAGDQVEADAATLWKQIINDEGDFAGNNAFEWDPAELKLEDVTRAKHAIMGSDFASDNADDQKKAREKYNKTWQYRINIYDNI